MKTKVRALDSFVHGRLNVARGAEFYIGHGDAQDLEAAGLVEIITESADDATVEKMEPDVQNKMESAPENKQVKKK